MHFFQLGYLLFTHAFGLFSEAEKSLCECRHWIQQAPQSSNRQAFTTHIQSTLHVAHCMRLLLLSEVRHALRSMHFACVVACMCYTQRNAACEGTQVQ
jgi:hypothetical protein